MTYFHELTDEEWEALRASGATWGEIMQQYEQPPWCGYPEALGGAFGCWSLVGRMVKDESYCQDCELYCQDGANSPVTSA